MNTIQAEAILQLAQMTLTADPSEENQMAVKNAEKNLAELSQTPAEEPKEEMPVETPEKPSMGNPQDIAKETEAKKK